MSGLEPRPDTMIQNPDKTILYPGPRQVQPPPNGSGTLWSLQQAASPSIPATARVQGSPPAEGPRSQTRPVKRLELRFSSGQRTLDQGGSREPAQL